MGERAAGASTYISYDNPCPVCGADAPETFRIYFDGFIKLFRCGCGFVGHFGGPGKFDAPDYANFFRDGGLPGDDAFYPPRSASNFEDMVRRIERHKAPPADLLDVGCYGGHFLQIAQAAGYSVHGVEAAEEVAAYAREKTGIGITSGAYGKDLLDAGSFDVITMMHVFEHVFDPSDLMEAARHHLRSRGLLVIDVPSLWNPVMLVYSRMRIRRLAERFSEFSAVNNQHFAYYQPRTLQRMIERHGFRVVEIATGRYAAKYGLGKPRLRPVIRAVDRVSQRFQVGTIFAVAQKV